MSEWHAFTALSRNVNRTRPTLARSASEGRTLARRASEGPVRVSPCLRCGLVFSLRPGRGTSWIIRPFSPTSPGRRRSDIFAGKPARKKPGGGIHENAAIAYHREKGVGNLLCEAPGGPFRQEVPDPFPLLVLFAAAAAGLFAVRAADAQALESLPRLCDFEMRRITSTDPKGGNHDFRELPPGGTLVLAELSGPGCIVHFRDNITSREPHHLQMHVLRMYWDGETTPSVEVPVGDFFGVGFGFTEKCSSAIMAIDDRRGPTNTNPSATGDARNCYFPMPFAKGAKITITNEGQQPSLHWFEVNCKIFKRPQADVGYFHAQYRQGTPPPTGPYLILDARGAGTWWAAS